MTLASGPEALTPREREVLRLVAEGYAPKEVAGILMISLLTVQTHLRNTYAKLAATGQGHAVAIAWPDLFPERVAPGDEPALLLDEEGFVLVVTPAGSA